MNVFAGLNAGMSWAGMISVDSLWISRAVFSALLFMMKLPNPRKNTGLWFDNDSFTTSMNASTVARTTVFSIPVFFAISLTTSAFVIFSVNYILVYLMLIFGWQIYSFFYLCRNLTVFFLLKMLILWGFVLLRWLKGCQKLSPFRIFKQLNNSLLTITVFIFIKICFISIFLLMFLLYFCSDKLTGYK